MNKHLSILLKSHRYDDAIIYLTNYIINAGQNDHAAISDLGSIFYLKSDYQSAINCYKKAIALHDKKNTYFSNAGTACLDLGLINEAEEYFNFALNLSNKSDVNALNGLGLVNISKNNYDKSILFFKSALKLKPDFYQATNNLANVMRDAGKIQYAKNLYKNVLKANNNYFEALHNLGNIYLLEGNYSEAINSFDQALKISPHNAKIRFSKSLLLLKMGRLLDGWREYETRFDALDSSDYNIYRPFFEGFGHNRVWNGERLETGQLWIWLEQGNGDTFMMCRFIPYAYKVCGSLVNIVAPNNLAVLLRYLNGVNQIYSIEDAFISYSKNDKHIPLMSLPNLLNINRSDIEKLSYGYLKVNSPANPIIQEFFTKHSDKLNIGIFWSGNASYSKNKHRSISLDTISKLRDIPGINWINLQRGIDKSQPAGTNWPMFDLTDGSSDWLETANILSKLDLLITVDSGIAHLCGALGKPVWILLSREADWRWENNCETSYWYNSARLFWQKEFGSWIEVIESLHNALSKLAAQRNSHITSNTSTQISMKQAVLEHGNGNYKAAIDIYDHILSIHPKNIDALHLKGVLQCQNGNYDEGFELIQSALLIHDHDANIWSNYGEFLRKSKRFNQAVDALKRALVIDPNNSPAHLNLALAYKDTNFNENAEFHYKKCLELDPSQSSAHQQLGLLYLSYNRYDDALYHLEKSTNLLPDNNFILSELIHAKMWTCDWSDINHHLSKVENKIISPFVCLSLPNTTERWQKSCAKECLTKEYGIASQSNITSRNKIDTNRITIGYFSNDFYNHATSYLIAGIMETHDKDKFNILGLSYGVNDGTPINKRLRSAFSEFVDLYGVEDLDAEKVIYSRKIDILVDLKGLTKGTRIGLLRKRLAPIQVSWLGYPGTLGASGYCEYIIGDKWVTPKESFPFFSEKIAQMPFSYQPNDNLTRINSPPDVVSQGIPKYSFVFCSFNQTYKITENIFHAWCQILLACPNSILWLLKTNTVAINNLKTYACSMGISPDRIIFAEPVCRDKHLARLRLAHLALDTHPYGSHTTGSDALRAGVPLVTQRGNTFASRVGTSLVHAIGMGVLSVASLTDYIQFAIKLYNDTELYNSLRNKLANNIVVSPLFNQKLFTEDLEKLFAKMVINYNNEIHDHITIE